MVNDWYVQQAYWCIHEASRSMGGGLEGIAIRRRLLNLADVVFVLLIPPLLPRAALYHAPCSSLASTQRGRDSEAKTTTSPDEDSQTSTTCTSSSFPYPPHSTFAPSGSEFVSCSCTASASSERDRFSPRVLILSLLPSRQPLHDVQASHVTRSIQPAQYIIRASLFGVRHSLSQRDLLSKFQPRRRRRGSERLATLPHVLTRLCGSPPILAAYPPLRTSRRTSNRNPMTSSPPPIPASIQRDDERRRIEGVT
jgi:hypothetical protein